MINDVTLTCNRVALNKIKTNKPRAVIQNKQVIVTKKKHNYLSKGQINLNDDDINYVGSNMD